MVIQFTWNGNVKNWRGKILGYDNLSNKLWYVNSILNDVEFSCTIFSRLSFLFSNCNNNNNCSFKHWK